MSTPIGTLELIRQLADAEGLGEDHAMELANYLNQNDGARHSWPGNMLFDFLVNVYEDGSMRSYELQALARIIEGILLQADGMAAEAAENEPPPIGPDEAPDSVLVLPDLHSFDELNLNGQVGMPDVFFSKMQCDCLDWQTSRRKVAPNSPGRICRHLAKHMFREIELLPSNHVNLRKLVTWAGRSSRSLPPQPKWRLLSAEDETLVAAWGVGKVCWVFAPINARGSLELFSYDLGENQWTLYNRPPQYLNEDLKAFLDQVVEASKCVATA